MARATRSSTQLQDPNDAAAVPASRQKAGSKKRKRQSIADHDDQPAAKQLRGDATIKEEGSQEPEVHEQTDEEPKLPHLQNAGDVSIGSDDAQKILDILEMIDTQGLLDRVFPLPAKPSDIFTPNSSPITLQSRSYSFRNLLKESAHHPLCVLRSAVQHLFPISSHPRSRPSIPAAQQLRFCNLALSLLDQASFHSVPIPLDLETLFPHPDLPADLDLKPDADDSKPAPSAESSTTPARKRKYALMQHLPTGDWWTSLNSDFALSSTDARELKDFPTGHAELVAILDSETHAPPAPTLGSYATKKPPGPKLKLPGPRLVSCGSFLDYGPYSSFAPSFDQDGVEVGRNVLGEVIWGKEQRKRAREIESIRPGSIEEVHGETDDIVMKEVQIVEEGEISQAETTSDEALGELLSANQVNVIKAALGSLELENAVQELLDRNRRALERLEELQTLRLTAEGGGSSDVEVGSEEWDIAQGILDSLTLLASLRPRSSADLSDGPPPLIPSASALRKLHQTLPLAPSQGWQGTLPTSRQTALRDDSTLRVKSGVTVPNVSTAPPTAPQPAPSAPATNSATGSSYPGYPYPNYAAAQYRTPGYTPYKPGQTSAYYGGAYGAQTQGAAQPGGAAAYYQNQQYAAAGQQPYSYASGGSWYNYQPQNSAATGGSTSGRGTPQPPAGGAAIPSSTLTNYTGHYPQQPAAQPGRAVANTVLSAAANKTYPQNMSTATWSAPGKSTPGGYAPPTLPPHLRTAAGGGGSQPGTPGGTYQPNYYGTYQPTPPAAR